jgi:glutaredoxin
MAKEYFKANNIAYDEKNVTNPEFRKELLGMGLRSVPVIFVNEERMVGFDQQAFEDLYQNA